MQENGFSSVFLTILPRRLRHDRIPRNCSGTKSAHFLVIYWANSSTPKGPKTRGPRHTAIQVNGNRGQRPLSQEFDVGALRNQSNAEHRLSFVNTENRQYGY